MNKMVSRVVALTGAAMFAGALVSGVGAPAKQVEARHIGGAAGAANFMNTVWDNGTNVQVFKTDYGYGAWATDSNGYIIGDEPIAKTPYYLADEKLNAKKDTAYGDFVAAYEVTVNPIASYWGLGSGNTVQVYYDEADFAQNVTDHFDHMANGLPVVQNDYTAAAALDKNGGSSSPYVFGFEFGDYNPNYVEFGATTWNLKNYNNKDKAFVNNDEVGVWTNTKLPDFGAEFDVVTKNAAGKVTSYIPEVYANPVFEDAWSLVENPAFVWEEDLLDGRVYTDPETGDVYDLPGQLIPLADGSIDWDEFYLGTINAK